MGLDRQIAPRPTAQNELDLVLRLSGRSSIAKDVPKTDWPELEPFWPEVAAAILEVFFEGGYSPYSATKRRPDGFYAYEWYWARSKTHPQIYPLRETKRFLAELKNKPGFMDAIRRFNNNTGSDWTTGSGEKLLRQFVYSACYRLEDYVRKHSVER